MYQTFFIGRDGTQRAQDVDLSAIKTVEQLKTILATRFPFADAQRKLK